MTEHIVEINTGSTFDVLLNIGIDGTSGVDGLSAYEVAVENGFVGTEQEWLTSLEGTDGTNGTNGTNGINGTNGVDGDSAYEIAVANGFVGTEQQWLDSLVGADGVDGIDGAFSSTSWTPVNIPVAFANILSGSPTRTNSNRTITASAASVSFVTSDADLYLDKLERGIQFKISQGGTGPNSDRIDVGYYSEDSLSNYVVRFNTTGIEDTYTVSFGNSMVDGVVQTVADVVILSTDIMTFTATFDGVLKLYKNGALVENQTGVAVTKLIRNRCRVGIEINQASVNIITVDTFFTEASITDVIISKQIQNYPNSAVNKIFTISGVSVSGVQSSVGELYNNDYAWFYSSEFPIGRTYDHVVYDGTDGVNGVQGEPGLPGADGTNGTNGVDGLDGTGIVAWVNFNGTGTPAIRASLNVSSITDLALGQWQINFTNPLSDENYSVAGSAGFTAGFGDAQGGVRLGTRSTNNTRIACALGFTAAYVDPTLVNIMVTR